MKYMTKSKSCLMSNNCSEKDWTLVRSEKLCNELFKECMSSLHIPLDILICWNTEHAVTWSLAERDLIRFLKDQEIHLCSECLHLWLYGKRKWNIPDAISWLQHTEWVDLTIQEIDIYIYIWHNDFLIAFSLVIMVIMKHWITELYWESN